MKKPVIPKPVFGAIGVLIAVIAFLLIFGGGLFSGGEGGDKENRKESEAGKTKLEKADGGEKQASYICPMHPEIVSDKPGSCPVCGMHLVKQKKEEGGGDLPHKKHEGGAEAGHGAESAMKPPPQQEKGQEGPSSPEESLQIPPEGAAPAGRATVRLSLRKRQMTGIRLAKAEKKPLFKSIRAPGLIAFDPELYTAQNEYLSALKQWRKVKGSPVPDVRESVRQMIRSSKIRLKVIGLSDKQIQDLTKKGARSENLLISGKSGGAWIYADVFEADLPHIKAGLSAEIKADFLPGQILSGETVSADRVINPRTRTARVRIRLSQPNPSLRPESYVNVTIKSYMGKHIAVPLDAVMNTGRESFLFVKKEGGLFEPRRVRVLFETDEEAALSENGAKEGEEVVAEGNFMMDSESRLKALVRSAGS